MTRSLWFPTAARMAWREARSAPAKFLFVVLAVAVGVGSLAGVRGFSDAFRSMLLKEARTLMAADLTVRIFTMPGAQQNETMELLESRGVRRTWVTETFSMASSAAGEPLLVSIKAVDPAVYPFYGSAVVDPPAALHQALQADTALVSDDLLLRLGAAPGDAVRLGGSEFRIAGVLRLEPDRMTGSLNVGPRIMISREALERTGLMQPGSRASQRFLFRLGPGAPGIAELRRTLQRAFPDAQIADYRETHPAIARGLRRATTFLSLASLIALIVGALGVAMAMHSHLQQKMDTIATLKCLGARSGQVLRIYLTQALLLGLAGSLLGIAGGALVQRAFPPLLARYFSIDPGLSWSARPALEALGVGLAVTLLFTLPPLLGIRRIRPSLIFRREMAEARPRWRERLWRARASALAGAALVLAVAGIAAWLSESAEMGLLFAGALLASLAALSAVAWAMLRGARAFLRRSRLKLPLAVRHGLANLYRPGNHPTAVLVALGLGVTFILTVYLVERAVMRQLLQSSPRGLPNVFLVNVTSRERDGLLELLRRQQGLESAPELVPAVSARLLEVDEVPIRQLARQGSIRRFYRTRQLTWAARPPAYTVIVSGAWWPPGARDPAVCVSEEAAGILGVKPGSRLEWESAGRRVAARVACVHRTNETQIASQIEFILSEGALEGLPAVYFGAVRVRPPAVAALQRAAYERFPTVTVINSADVFEIVQEVVDRIALVVRFVSAFAILAGVVILAASVAGTRFRRVREVVILKTLGATRARVAAIFSVEFLALGAAAGLIGGVLATAFSGLLVRRLMQANAALDPLPALAAIGLTALLAVAAGWLASFRILRQKPLEALREE